MKSLFFLLIWLPGMAFSQNNIKSYEYWFDNDYASRTSINIVPVETFTLNTGINTSTLSPGLHIFNIRFSDDSSRYSALLSNYFYETGNEQITAYRYWTDNGDTAMINIPLVTPSSIVNFTNDINTLQLDTGYHWIYIQTRDGSGLWSSVLNKRFRNIGRPKLDHITPTSGGNTGNVTINVFGTGFFEGTNVKLARGADTIHIPDSMTFNYEGTRLKVTANLRNRTIGDYDVVVTVPAVNDTVMKLANGFRIVTGNSGEVITKINGPRNVRIGMDFQFSVSVTSTANIDRNLPLISLMSFNDNPIGFTKGQLEHNYHVLPIYFADSNQLADILPGETLTKIIYANAASLNGNFGIYQVADYLLQPVYDSMTNHAWDTTARLNTVSTGCSPDGCSFVRHFPFFRSDFFLEACNRHDICYATCSTNGIFHKGACDLRLENDLVALCNCNAPDAVTRGKCIAEARLWYLGLQFPVSLYLYSQAQQTCGCSLPNSPIPDCPNGCPGNAFYENGNDFPGPCYSPSFGFASDPNDKVGPVTPDAVNQYIFGEAAFNYVIHFENDSAATLPAQTVIVKDTLNKSVFDLSTFQLGNITIGDTIISIPPGLKTFTADVDLSNIGTYYTCRINASLNEITGVANWNLTTLESATLLPVNDPLAGFLPPNVHSPEGQASVSYSVKVYDTVAYNTAVNNKADIYFDNNPVVPTGTWHNKIDNKKPHSNVSLLPVYSDSIFSVNWTGIDTGAGIHTYRIYYSINGGLYRILLNNTTGNTFEFHGKVDSTYRFYSIATDKAGNHEIKDTVAEATTTVKLNGALPLHLLYFRLNCTGNNVVVKWQTADERPGDVYIIEKSNNGTGNWKAINTVNSSGSSNGNTYTFADAAGATAFYRLKQVNRDGEINYSIILRTSCGNTMTTLNVFPVPAKDILNVVIETNKNSAANILLIDVYGRVVKTRRDDLQRGVNSLTIDVSKLASGQYILKVEGDAEIKTQKILIAY